MLELGLEALENANIEDCCFTGWILFPLESTTWKSLEDKKEKKREKSDATTGARKRNDLKYNKLHKEQQQDIAAQTAGLQYESGIALWQATKESKKAYNTRSKKPKGDTEKQIEVCVVSR